MEAHTNSALGPLADHDIQSIPIYYLIDYFLRSDACFFMLTFISLKIITSKKIQTCVPITGAESRLVRNQKETVSTIIFLSI